MSCVKLIERNLGASPPDSDPYLAREVHPLLRDVRAKTNELALHSWGSAELVTNDDVEQQLAFLEVIDTTELRVVFRIRGAKDKGDWVHQEWDITWSIEDEVWTIHEVNKIKQLVYPDGATLTTACARWGASGDRLTFYVTGEATTRIRWKLYCICQEALGL